MFEVIPNWHPMLVHFPVALLSISTMFFVLLKISGNHPLKEQLRTLAYWNLWLGTGFAIVAAIAGWYAYNSVAHDTPSHVAMTSHRDWALITLLVFIVISIWSVKLYKSIKNESIIFTIIMLFAFVLLAATGWRGSEVVYRYGLGVMSLPKVSGDGHAHEHGSGSEHDGIDGSVHHDNLTDNLNRSEKKSDTRNTVIKDDHSNHNHKH